MGKRPSLAETMRQVAVAAPEQPPIPTPALAIVAPLPTPAPEPSQGDAAPRPYFAATRVGKKKVTLGLSPTAHKQLKGLALDQDKTAEILLAEAVRDLFAKYGKPAID